MSAVIVRAFIVYAVIIIFMRIMGKRQLGQMQLSEFVTAMILSELAALPIADRSIPFIYGLVPLSLIICFEVICSFLSVRSTHAQKFLEGTPTLLVEKGKLNQKEFVNSRITLKELLVELRLKGLASISEAEYVFLEPNGKFSVIPKPPFRQVTNGDIDNKITSTPVDYSIIVDGKIIKESLAILSKDMKWVNKTISPSTVKEILYLSANEDGKITLIVKDKDL